MLRGLLSRLPREGVALFLISFVGLYLELVAIRWVPTQVRLLAYFSNFVLIACLLGLGLGMVLDRRRTRLLPLFAPGLVLVVGAVLVLEETDFRLPFVSGNEWLWNTADQAASTVSAYLVLVAFVLLVALAFVPLGQEIGLRLRAFRPVAAYSVNVAGSLAGVLAFAVVSYVELDPAWWFAIGLAALLAYGALAAEPWPTGAAAAGVFVGVVAVVYAFGMADTRGSATYWSPYYRIQVAPLRSGTTPVGFDVKVNRDSHQQALDLSGRLDRVPLAHSRRILYDLPYRLVRARRVLVVGAGTGNDVAAARRANPSAEIDAVEIDPRIAELGWKLHPEHPYASPHVHVHIDDARAYFTRTSNRYDAIIFGFLDSHRLFSHMSSVRLDNYVYTTRSLQSVRRLLRPDGIVALTFTVHEKWIADRLYGLVAHAFGHPPLVYQGDRNTIGTMFIDSPRRTPPVPAGVPRIGLDAFRSSVLGHGARVTWNYLPKVSGMVDDRAFVADSRLPTDEWPYLYMRSAGIPPNYLEVLLLTLVGAGALVWLLAPRVDFRRPSSWNFFALGAAFALLETRGVTEIGLVLGSTWVTNAVVISAILLMALLANLVVTRVPRLPLRPVYALLFLVLAFNYLVSLRNVLGLSYGLAVATAGLQVGLPMLLSGIVFARSLAASPDAGVSLGANLMGAVLGALLEYSSLVFGLRELYLAALAFYLVSFLVTARPAAGRGEAPALGRAAA